MKPLDLTLRGSPRTWVDMSPLTPDRLAGLDRSALRKLRLRVGRDRVPLSDLFDIDGSDAASLQIRRAVPQLIRIGEGMSGGSIQVQGHAGQSLGRGMRGGVIDVQGHAGDRAAAGMSGGTLYVSGNAGDYVGSSLPGAVSGMSGGKVVIRGNAGARLGDTMRRGTICVMRDAGDFPGSQMLAGTILVLGRVGRLPGYAMRRGTLIFRGMPDSVLPTFHDCGTLDLEFLQLLFRQLSSTDRRLAVLARLGSRARRFAGDAAVGGVGELFVLPGGRRR